MDECNTGADEPLAPNHSLLALPENEPGQRVGWCKNGSRWTTHTYCTFAEDCVLSSAFGPVAVGTTDETNPTLPQIA